MQTRIPCTLMRGGTSKGAYFLAEDLPSSPQLRNEVLVAVMGSPDKRQIDGLGGANPLTSKVAIVSPSLRADADVDYLFAQVKIEVPEVDITPNCGNMLAGVGPFAIERGLVSASNTETLIRIHMVNSGNLAEVTVQTPGGRVSYSGDTKIDGVPRPSAPLMINFLNTAGSVCGVLLPTGALTDDMDGLKVTCIDNGMPIVLLKAEDLGVTGYESHEALTANSELRKQLERIRLKLGPKMNLGDVTDKVVPKMCLIAPSRAGGAITTRTFIPHVCHSAVGVLGAVTVATACMMEGTVAHDLADLPPGNPKMMSIEHPTGEFSVEIEMDRALHEPVVKRSALLRTTRSLMEGHALIPANVWEGKGE